MDLTNSGKRAANPTVFSGVDLIVEAHENEKNEFVLEYKKHMWKSLKTLARSMFVANGLSLDDLKHIEREFIHNFDDGKSPLKKKLKAGMVVDQHNVAESHAFSEEEINRVRNLKKSDLCSELKVKGILHKGYMTKAVLIDVYFNGMIQMQQQSLDLTNKENDTQNREVTSMEIDLEAKDVQKSLPIVSSEHRFAADTTATNRHPMKAQSPSFHVASDVTTKNKVPVATQQPTHSGAVRRIVAEKEQQMARLPPAAFPMSSAKKFPISETKASHQHALALSPIAVDLFASKRHHIDPIDRDVTTPGVGKMEVEQQPPLTTGIRSCEVKHADSNTFHLASSSIVDATSKVGSIKKTSGAESVKGCASILAFRNIEPTHCRIQATPLLTGPLTGSTSHMPGTSETVKAHLKDRNARAAQLKEETKKNALAMEARGLQAKTNLFAQSNAKSMNERLQAMQAKRRAELDVKGISKNIATVLDKQAPQPASPDGKTGLLSPPRFKSPVDSPQPRVNAPYHGSPVLANHNSGLVSQLIHSNPAPSIRKEETFVNYDMTDTEDYDSEEGSVGSQAESKPVPKWAQKSNLIKFLERQYSSSYKVDPDELFGEVFTCDLELIFNRKTNRYRRRQSSGEWSAHRVTESEKRAYKLAVR